MKIKRTVPKKLVPASDIVQDVINEIMSCPDAQLPKSLLSHSLYRSFPSSDLFHWIAVLDKFDSMLQQTIASHEFALVQRKEFSVESKELVMSILTFSRYLVEHSINRYIYNSYEHLNTLLTVTDLDVLDLTLRLLFTFSYRFGGRTLAKSNTYNIDLETVQVLARCDPPLEKDKPTVNYLQFCSPLEPDQLALNWSTTFSFRFYRQATPSTGPSNEMETDSATEKSASNGLVLIKKSKLNQIKKSCLEITSDLIAQYKIPDEYHFSLFQRVRMYKEIFDSHNRVLLFSIRFLALAILSPYIDNNLFSFHNELFKREPTFLPDISALISISNPVPITVRSSAVHLFDSLIRNRVGITDALSALNFGTFNGVLSEFFKFIFDNAEKECYSLVSEDFTESMFNIATYVVSSQSGGTQIVASGIIPLIVGLVEKNGQFDRNAEFVRKCVSLLDNILYSFPNVFSQFQNAEGVSKFVQEISRICIKAISNGYSLTPSDGGVPDCGTLSLQIKLHLKALLNSILRLMQSSGTVDGLRNLIETSLPSSLVLVFQNLSLFGSDNYAHAISILATFINNEPTALSVLLEMNLPQVFLQAIHEKIPISYEVVNAIFLALGAVCLNNTGLQLVRESRILSKLLEILIQREYLRMLQKTDCPTAIGAGFDEFIRHHPSLKDEVFFEVISIFDKIHQLSQSVTDPDELTNCTFLLPPQGQLEGEVAIGESFPKVEHKEPLIPQIVETVCVFLEAFLQPETNKKQFLDLGGFLKLLKFYSLPTLCYDFSSSVYSFSLFHLFKVLIEFQPDTILSAMFNELYSYLVALEPFIGYYGDRSYFLPAIDAKSMEELEPLQNTHHFLQAIHGISSLLTDVYSTRSVSSRLGMQFLESLFDSESNIQTFRLLWKTYNACTFEFHQFKRSVPQVWLNKPRKDSTQENVAPESEQTLIADPNDRRIRNMKAIKYLLTQIPTSFIPLTCKLSELVGDGKTHQDPSVNKRKTDAISLLISSLEQSFKWQPAPSQVDVWFDYINVILGHTLVLFFEELDSRQTAINIASLEHFVSGGMQCLDDSVDFALANATLIDEKNAKSTLSAFVTLAAKFVDIELLKSLEFVHPTDADFIIKLRLKGMEILMKIWKHSIFDSFSDVIKALVLMGFKNVLFNGPYNDPIMPSFEPSQSSIDDLVKLGFPSKIAREALMPFFGATNNEVIIYMVTRDDLRDDNGRPLSSEMHSFIAEFKQTFNQRILQIISKPVIDTLLDVTCSLLRQVYDVDFESLYEVIDSIPSADMKFHILSILAPEQQGFKSSPLTFLCTKLDSFFSQAKPSNYLWLLCIIESILTHEESVPDDVSKKCIAWIHEILVSTIPSDTVLLALFRCAVVVNKRYSNQLDITLLIGALSNCIISDQIAPSIFSLAAILSHLFVQNDLYDSHLFDSILEHKMAGKFDKMRAVTTGLEYAMKINSQVFQEVAKKKIFGQDDLLAESNESSDHSTSQSPVPSSPKVYERSVESVNNELKLIIFLMSAILNHKQNDIFQRICLLLLAELFHSYQSSSFVLLNEAVPTKAFLTLLLQEFIPFPMLLENSNELKSDEEKSAYFRSFLSQFIFVLLINECGIKDEKKSEENKEDTPSLQTNVDSLTSLRKLVFDLFFKVFRETFYSPSIPIMQKYGAIQAYADLLYRFFSSKLTKKLSNSIIIFCVKYCNEKKILPFLCQSLQEFDVNYPRSFLLFNSILKPVEFITRIINKFNQAKQQNSTIISSQKIPADYSLSLSDNEMTETMSEDELDDEMIGEDEMTDDSFEMMDDEIVYGTEEDDFDSGLDEMDESDTAESDMTDGEIVIRPHAPIYTDDEDDEDENDMDTEEFFRSNDDLAEFEGPIDIVIEERFENEGLPDDDEVDDVHFRQLEENEFNQNNDDESETESQDDYVVYEGDEDFTPSNDDEMTVMRRIPIHFRNDTLGNGVDWQSSMADNGNGVIRLDWRMPPSATDTAAPYVQNHPIGEVAFVVPSHSLSPSGVLHPFDIHYESNAQPTDSDPHFTPAASLRRPTPSGNSTAASAIQPSPSSNPPFIISSFTMTSVVSSNSTRPSLRRADAPAGHANSNWPNPLIVINSMHICLVQTRWIQMDRLLGRAFNSKSKQEYTKMVLEFETERAKNKKEEEGEPEKEEESSEHSNESDYTDEDMPPVAESAPTVPAQPVADYVDNGIDVSFLEAIPLDLRQEVLSQHFEQRRSQVSPGASIVINPDFLASLSPDLRTAYLHESEREVQLHQALQPSGNNMADIEMFHNHFMDFVRDLTNNARRHDAISYDFNGDESGDDDDGDDSGEDDDGEDEDEEGDYNERHQMSDIPGKKPSIIFNTNLDACIDIGQLELLLISWYLAPVKTKRRYYFIVFENALNNSQVRNQCVDLLLEHLQSFVYDNLDRVFGKSYSSELLPNKNVLIEKLLNLFLYLVDNNRLVVIRLCEEIDKLAYLLADLNSVPSSSTPSKKRTKQLSKRTTKIPLLLLFHLFSFLDRKERSLTSRYLGFISRLLAEMHRLHQVPVQEAESGKTVVHLNKIPTVPASLLDDFIGHAVESIESSNKLILTVLFKQLVRIPTVKQKIFEILFSICKRTLLGALSDQLLQLQEIPRNSSSEMLRLAGIFRMIDSILESEGTDPNWSEIVANLDSFSPLWNQLDRLLSLSSSEEQPVSSVIQSPVSALLPLIESMFLTVKWKNQSTKSTTTNEISVKLPTSEPEPFFVFIEKYKTIFNHLIRGTPSLLSGSFAILVKFPKLIDFDNKRNWFRGQLKKQSLQQSTINLTVRRASIFEDTFQKIMTYSGKELRNARLNVKFYQEEGVDAGGVTREFFSELARQIFNPDYALFRTSALDRITYQPNRSSWVNPDHLQYFEFVGRIIGKAIVDGRLLDCYFTRSFYKHILGIPVDYRDMEAVDPDIYKSLCWILENEIGNVLELTFSTEMDDFGKTRIVDLIQNGRDIPVTDSNKQEYVKLVSEQKLFTAISGQINAFLRGFHSLISQDLLVLFDENELELLISGMPDIDVDDWKNNTTYEGYTAASTQIQWFWRAVRSFDLEQRAKLLQFTTGTSKVPLEGFQALQGSNGVQRFQIHRDFGSVDRLPSAHTCFNQLDLPLYVSYEQLRAQLVLAINECATGFGLV